MQGGKKADGHPCRLHTLVAAEVRLHREGEGRGGGAHAEIRQEPVPQLPTAPATPSLLPPQPVATSGNARRTGHGTAAAPLIATGGEDTCKGGDRRGLLTGSVIHGLGRGEGGAGRGTNLLHFALIKQDWHTYLQKEARHMVGVPTPSAPFPPWVAGAWHLTGK